MSARTNFKEEVHDEEIWFSLESVLGKWEDKIQSKLILRLNVTFLHHGVVWLCMEPPQFRKMPSGFGTHEAENLDLRWRAIFQKYLTQSEETDIWIYTVSPQSSPVFKTLPQSEIQQHLLVVYMGGRDVGNFHVFITWRLTARRGSLFFN